MRVLGIGDYGDLGDLYLHLVRAGHEVRMAVADPAYRAVFAGAVAHTQDWRGDLDWVRAAGRDGFILFETAHDGALQDALRADGFQVIGGCAYGDRLEGDRLFGQEVMRAAGMQIAASEGFTDPASAIAYIRQRPRRYVCKHNGHHLPSTRNHVGVLADGADIIAVLRQLERQGGATDFILMDHVEGVETGVGAYFDGTRFVGPVCLDWEHKRFFTGDLGELTGEMGTVVTYRGGERLFAETLAPLEPLLARHGYGGYLNLNTIINAQGVWPLEFTCRFGYPGFAILDALHADGWEPFLRAMAGQPQAIATHPGFAVGVVLTVPPFPYLSVPSPSRGLPICFRDRLSPEELRNLHFGEVDFSSGEPQVTGDTGYVLVATGRGEGVAAASAAAYALIASTVVPAGRYRTDIGARLAGPDGEELRRLGYLPGAAPGDGRLIASPRQRAERSPTIATSALLDKK